MTRDKERSTEPWSRRDTEESEAEAGENERGFRLFIAFYSFRVAFGGCRDLA